MKREFLQNFKVGDQSLPKEIIDAILDENGKDIESVKGKYADYDAIKKQLDEANRTIDGFKDMDIDAVRKEASPPARVVWIEMRGRSHNQQRQPVATREGGVG